MLRLGVHNDKGTPDIECLLSQWRMLYYNKTCSCCCGSLLTLQQKLLLRDPQGQRGLRWTDHCQALLGRGLPDTSHNLPRDLPNCSFGQHVIRRLNLELDEVRAKRLDENTEPIILHCQWIDAETTRRRFWISMRYLPQMSGCIQ